MNLAKDKRYPVIGTEDIAMPANYDAQGRTQDGNGWTF